MSIRYQLKNYRLSKNYTQQYLADQLFISRQQYCNIENGRTEKISEENKKKLAALLDIPTELMDRMDILLYTKKETEPYRDDETHDNHKNSERLIESLKEQNKQLMLLLEKLTEKLG